MLADLQVTEDYTHANGDLTRLTIKMRPHGTENPAENLTMDSFFLNPHQICKCNVRNYSGFHPCTLKGEKSATELDILWILKSAGKNVTLCG